MNCGRGVAFFGAEAISKSDRFPGANCGRKAALAFAFAFALASGEQGLDCSPLAGLRPGRVGTRALAGAHWHKAGPSPGPGAEGFAGLAGCPDVPSSFRLRPGRWEKEPSSQGPRSGKAKRRLPFTLGAFLRDWTRSALRVLQGPVRALTGGRLPCLRPGEGRLGP